MPLPDVSFEVCEIKRFLAFFTDMERCRGPCSLARVVQLADGQVVVPLGDAVEVTAVAAPRDSIPPVPGHSCIGLPCSTDWALLRRRTGCRLCSGRNRGGGCLCRRKRQPIILNRLTADNNRTKHSVRFRRTGCRMYS